jgi:hypothetical protein
MVVHGPASGASRRAPSARRTAIALFGTLAVTPPLVVAGPTAGAEIVPTVDLGSAGGYSVLGNETVTNTGPSVLDLSVGVWDGSEITGFPFGTVTTPGIVDDGATATAGRPRPT